MPAPPSSTAWRERSTAPRPWPRPAGRRAQPRLVRRVADRVSVLDAGSADRRGLGRRGGGERRGSGGVPGTARLSGSSACAGSRSSSPVLALLAAGCGKSSARKRRRADDRRRRPRHEAARTSAQTIRQGVELAASRPERRRRRSRGEQELPAEGQALRQPSLRAARPPGHATRDGRRCGRDRHRRHGRRRDLAAARRDGVRSTSSTTAGPSSSTPQTRPNVFRIAPTDHGIAFRYAEYLVPKKLKVGLLSDDCAYGREAGAPALGSAFSSNPKAIATELDAPSGADRPHPAGPARAPVRALPPCSSGARRRRSRAVRAARRSWLGRPDLRAAGRRPTRSSASSSATTRSGSTASPSRPGA